MWRHSILKKDSGENPISCPLAFGRLFSYLLGSFSHSINRELEGGHAFDFPADLGVLLRLSAPSALHLQNRSSECNRPFILMTLFYWCRNAGPESKGCSQGHRNELEFPIGDLTLSYSFPSLSQAWACDKKESGNCGNCVHLRYFARFQPNPQLCLLECNNIGHCFRPALAKSSSFIP